MHNNTPQSTSLFTDERVEDLIGVAEAMPEDAWTAISASRIHSPAFEGKHEVASVDRQWGLNRSFPYAQFIATFDPPTVLALLRALETARRERDTHARQLQLAGEHIVALEQREHTAEAELAAERARSAGWQPIERCPSDGRKVLTFGGRRTEVTLEMADGEYWARNQTRAEQAVPTHWMPLPAPPTTSEGGE